MMNKLEVILVLGLFQQIKRMRVLFVEDFGRKKRKENYKMRGIEKTFKDQDKDSLARKVTFDI